VNDAARVERRPGESIEGMLRRFKRHVDRSGILPALRVRQFAVGPEERKRAKRRRAAKRRERKAARVDAWTP